MDQLHGGCVEPQCRAQAAAALAATGGRGITTVPRSGSRECSAFLPLQWLCEFSASLESPF